MQLSKEKRDRIAEQILSNLYHNYPKAFFTAQIAKDVARDEEFIKTLLQELKTKDLINAIKKNPEGTFYSRRIRWMLSPKAFDAYKSQV